LVCFIASTDPKNLVQLKENILEKVHGMFISDFSQAEGELHRTLRHHACSIRRFCHSLFQLSPNDDERRFNDVEIAAVSPWALDVLLSAYEEGQADASLKLYDLIVKKPEAAVLRAQIFEKQVVKYFATSLEELVHFKVDTIFWMTLPLPSGRFLVLILPNGVLCFNQRQAVQPFIFNAKFLLLCRLLLEQNILRLSLLVKEFKHG
jgi:hypothetical protein